MRIRNSFRRRGSLHRKEEHDSHGQNHAGLNSEEDLVVSLIKNNHCYYKL